MKNYWLIATLVLISSVTSKAQVNFENVKKQKVQITNTNGRSVILLSTFYNTKNEEQILKQLTKEQFEVVKRNEEEKEWPKCFSSDDLFAESLNNIEPKYKNLVAYNIATFDNWQNGEKFDTIAILYVPIDENKELDKTGEWKNDVFILMPIQDIKVL